MPSTKLQADTVRDLLMDRTEKLAAKEGDIFLESRWRPKKSLNNSEYWAYIRQVNTNRAPNEC